MKAKTTLRNYLVFIALLRIVNCLIAADDPRPVVNDSNAVPQTAANPALPTLYIAGDSTARSDAPLRGWGSEIGAFFDPTKINIVNRAIGGRSTRTFITDGRWDKILANLKPGDFALVQFGHNDAGDYKDPKAKGRPSIHSEGDETAQALKSDLKTMETIHSFGWYMRKFANDAKAKGATPILISMVPHKDWRDGKIVRHERNTFVKWTRNAADSTGALFIDANEIITEGLERLGPEKVKPLFGDARTHSTPEGAKYNAAAIVVGIKALQPNPLQNYFSKLADDLPPTLIAPTNDPAK
ncbi:MAG TPA: rhamnogalacturonan acetylesterase [Verrucomicrobiae bacterium]|jgi:lysophospholipase L1-like esterase